MKPCPIKDQKTIFFSDELFIVKTQFEISKYLLSIFMSSNVEVGFFRRSVQLVPKTSEAENRKKEKVNKSMLIFVVLCALSSSPTNM